MQIGLREENPEAIGRESRGSASNVLTLEAELKWSEDETARLRDQITTEVGENDCELSEQLKRQKETMSELREALKNSEDKESKLTEDLEKTE